MARDAIQVAVDRLAERLQRSVVVNDAGVHLLYASAHFGDEDPVRVRAVLQRQADSRAVGHVLAQGVSTWTSAGVIPPNPDLEMKARVCVPVRWRGELLGLLMVMDADGSVTTSELGDITRTAGELAPVLAQQAREDADGALLERTVGDLVGREPLLRRRALAELAAAGVDGGFPVVAAVALGAQGASEDGVAHAETALRSALTMRTAAGGRLFAVTGASALVLVGGPAVRDERSLRTAAEQLVRQVRDLSAGRFDCVAGIGSVVPGLERAVESAGQARLACRAAAGVLGGPVATWGELGPYGLLLRLPPEDLDDAALPAELRRLQEADRDGTLTRTVRAYLDHAGNGPAAAAALHVHRTTLYYRLGRVTELTGLDLDDGRTRLTLHLGLTALDLVEAYG